MITTINEFKKILENAPLHVWTQIPDYKTLMKLRFSNTWEYAGDDAVKNMEHDDNKPATMYINDKYGVAISMYCLNKKWYITTEYTNGKSETNDVIDRDDAVDALKWILNIDDLQYYKKTILNKIKNIFNK